MYSVAFIFKPKTYDDDFHRLNDAIQAVADAMPGFLGQETWQSSDGKMFNATYYWETAADLKAFATHPKHLEAKSQYDRWYAGYQVVVSEVKRSYGDGHLGHITASDD